MSTPRITQRVMVSHSLFSLQAGLNRLSDSQEKLTTGRTINRPSDNPTGTNDAMRLRAAISAADQHTRNAQDGLSWLGTADSTLQSMLDGVRSARDLIVQGLNTGANGADARAALGQQLTQLRGALLDQANTQYLGRPVFGGTTTSTVAYDASGTFVGDGNAVTRTISDGTTVAVNVSGQDAFTSGADDLFGVLGDAASLVNSNPAALKDVLTRLDAVSGSMRTSLTSVGSRYAQVESTVDSLSASTLATKSSLSDIENVDAAQAIMDVQMQQVAYQASLGATARVLQPTLLDFLR
jgi:flagellar hook-associated protein 3 FlgL